MTDEPVSRDYAVVSAEGLQLLVNLSRSDALEIQNSGTYPPAGDTPGVCYALPMRIAESTHRLWNEYREQYERKCREARLERMKQMATCYDDATQDRAKPDAKPDWIYKP